ncbi:MAG: aryl-sulfate sulfotransferase [Sandaracinaceae bacterium]
MRTVAAASLTVAAGLALAGGCAAPDGSPGPGVDPADGGRLPLPPLDGGRSPGATDLGPPAEGTPDASRDEPWDGGGVRPPVDGGVQGALALRTSWRRPSGRPLVVELTVAADEPVNVMARVDGPGVAGRVVPALTPGATVTLPLVALAESSTYALEVEARGLSGRTGEARLEVTTGAIPEDVRPQPSLLPGSPADAPGLVVLGMNRGNQVVYFAVDGAGRIVWHYADRSRPGFAAPLIRPLPNGLFALFLPGEVRAVDAVGTTRWRVPVPAGEAFHHDFQVLPSGNVLALSEEVRMISVPGEGDVPTLGDVIVEIDRAGTVVERWAALDHLDGTRYPGPLARTMVRGGTVRDWSHGNAITYRASDSSVLLSLRHQHWIVRVAWPSGMVDWILGDDGDFDLESPGLWFSAQHAPAWARNGRLLVYDNGNERGDTAEPYTRVVEYRLDPDLGEAEETWSWRAPHYTAFVGDVDELSGTYLVTAGTTPALGGGAIYEVDRAGTVRWSLAVRGGSIYRSERVPEIRMVP